MQLSIFDVLSSEEREPALKTNKALIVDGNNLLSRAFFATSQRLIPNTRGEYTNGVNTFLKMLLTYIKELNITHVAVAFDISKGFRKELFAGYKENRGETAVELKQQFPIIKEILSNMNIPVLTNSNYEADDIIASFVHTYQTEMECYILSNDADVLQLASDKVKIITRKGKEDMFIDEQLFINEYGFSPVQLIDFKAIVGDSSDGYKGAEGIGKKGATDLLSTYGELETMLQVTEYPKKLKNTLQKLQASKENVLLCKRLATLISDIPLAKEEISKLGTPINFHSLLQACEKYELNNLSFYVKRFWS